uniref:Uncharacterized protein n=1 Tax=Rhizophora mucronata TaxID=61149 RepID=A0A2P2NUR5_RHIMU
MIEKIEDGVINLSYVPIMFLKANILTKAMPKSKFEFLVNKPGMINIYYPVWKGVLENQIKSIQSLDFLQLVQLY